MSKPQIVVRQLPHRGNDASFGVVLTRSAVAERFGFKGLAIMRLYTKEAAEDWVSRLKSVRSRSKMRHLLLTHADWT